MTPHPTRSVPRATLLGAVLILSQAAHATVFDDAYQCLKANAKVALVTAEAGPKAVEFVVTQPQCVALVTSPAPVPTGIMVGTLGLTSGNVLPRTNPGCENALYTTGGKAVAEIMGKLGLLPASVNKLLADQASAIAIGEAVQAIPGASVAFASFSCGCGLSDVGLNPPKIAEIYNAVKASGEKCTAIIGNLMEGGSEALVAGVSNLGDVLAGQSKHVDPQAYYKMVFLPRMLTDYERYGHDTNALDVNLSKGTVPQCEHYFDKHTMSATNANKTCLALNAQYLSQYKQQLPILAEKSLMAKLRSGYTAMNTNFQSDQTAAGKVCTAAAQKAFPTSMPGSYRYLNACMIDMGAYFGYEVKRDPSYSSTNRYLVKKVSEQQWAARIVAAARNSPGLKAQQILEKTRAQVMADWEKQHAQKGPAWIAAIQTELGATLAQTKKAEEEFKDKSAKDAAANKAKADQAAAEAIAKAAQECKDDRCKAELAEFIRACKGSGTESQVMNGDLACAQNRPIAIDISAKRVAFYAALDFQVKKHLAIVCPPDMDCTSGVTRQRSEIDAEATKVWNYVREQGLARGTVVKAREAIAQESSNMLAPLSARKIVAENKPKGLVADIDPKAQGPAKTYTPPVLVAQAAPPKAPAEPVKTPNIAKPPAAYTPPPPVVAQATPPKAPPEPVKTPNIAKPPAAYTPPPPVVAQAAPPPTKLVMSAPPPTAKPPASFAAPPSGVAMAGASLPKTANVTGQPGGSAAGSLKIEGCEPRGAQDPSSLVCTTDAALNRCRSLIASGKVKACIKG